MIDEERDRDEPTTTTVHDQLNASAAAEMIAETLYLAERPEASVLYFDEIPQKDREDYRARGRLAVRRQSPIARQAAIIAAAKALAHEDGQTFGELRETSQARYYWRAQEAIKRYEWWLSETAYTPEQEAVLSKLPWMERGR